MDYRLEHLLITLALPLTLAITLVLARWLPKRRPGWSKRFDQLWSAAARKPGWVAAFLICLTLSACAVRWTLHGPPNPAWHDEFSYLLAADTFASGRHTNPTHPMWVHFESLHILHVPSYMSMYPPGQGLFLALGQVLYHPWVGVILSVCLMSALLFWAVRQWLTPKWAVLGGLLGVTVVLGTYWSFTYWGGAVNASAGALVTGAAGVLRKRPSRLHWALYALGCIGCANTRLYEGFVLCLLTSAYLAFVIFRRQRPLLAAHARMAIPGVLVFAAGAGWTMYYCKAVTGNPFRLPYVEHVSQYIARPVLRIDKRSPPTYRHKVIKDVYYGLRRTKIKTSSILYYNFLSAHELHFGYALGGLFLLSPLALRRRKARPAIVVAWGGVAALLLIPYFNPHYYSPFLAFFTISSVEAARTLRAWPGAGRRPAYLVLPLILLVLLAVRYGKGINEAILPAAIRNNAWSEFRQAFLDRLEAKHGKHLIFVRYQPDHNWHKEWVYNRADIDAAKVIWAREMTPEKDAELRGYFSGRDAWLVLADVNPPRLIRYPGPGVEAPAAPAAIPSPAR